MQAIDIIKHCIDSYVAMCIYEMIVNVEHDISQAYSYSIKLVIGAIIIGQLPVYKLVKHGHAFFLLYTHKDKLNIKDNDLAMQETLVLHF